MSESGADVGRAEVYAAELAAFDGTDLESVRHIGDVVAAIDIVVGAEWWPGPAVEALAARRGARSSSARRTGATQSAVPPVCAVRPGGAVQIRIARNQATIATAAHELAHALAGVDHGHDRVFRRAHLDVIAVITNGAIGLSRGGLHVDQLRESYEGAGLDIGQRDWPAPPYPDCDDGPIAL